MSRIINKSELYEFSKTRAHGQTLNERLLTLSQKTAIGKTTIFLSHKHDERKELESAISLFESMGVSIYVDWQDGGMPKTTSGATATRLKQKIRSNNKFVLLATQGAINSKWCNWELGLGDAAKYIEHIAILPIKEDYTAYTGAEYLGIYPYITFENGSYIIRYPAGKQVNLSDWLR